MSENTQPEASAEPMGPENQHRPTENQSSEAEVNPTQSSTSRKGTGNKSASDDSSGAPSGQAKTNQAPGDAAGGGESATDSVGSSTAEEGQPPWPRLLREAEERAVRLQADLENTRKRAQRETQEAYRYAPMSLIQHLLLVLDYVAFGLKAAEQTPVFAEGKVSEMMVEFANKSQSGEIPADQLQESALQWVADRREQADQTLLQGFKMTAMEFQRQLEAAGCQRIPAEAGQPFDPNLHQAIAYQPSDHPANTVLEERRAGFRLHERVVRPCEVVVSSGPSSEASTKPE